MSGLYECCYISGRCDRPECESYGQPGSVQPEPTVEDYCAANDHAYYGDECNPDAAPPEVLSTLGRCYCGERRYPAGGPQNPNSISDGEASP